MTYPEYTDIPPRAPLPTSRQKAIIDALTRLHPVGKEMVLEGIKKCQ